jgi:hypothetical protein
MTWFARKGFSARIGFLARIGFSARNGSFARNGFLAEMTVRQKLLFSKNTCVKFVTEATQF